LARPLKITTDHRRPIARAIEGSSLLPRIRPTRFPRLISRPPYTTYDLNLPRGLSLQERPYLPLAPTSLSAYIKEAMYKSWHPPIAPCILRCPPPSLPPFSGAKAARLAGRLGGSDRRVIGGLGTILTATRDIAERISRSSSSHSRRMLDSISALDRRIPDVQRWSQPRTLGGLWPVQSR